LQRDLLEVTDKKNQEIVKSIGRRLREALELSAALPPSREIELRLERLRRAEAQRQGGRDRAGAPAVRRLLPI
jgi:hypothetical protein